MASLPDLTNAAPLTPSPDGVAAPAACAADSAAMVPPAAQPAESAIAADATHPPSLVGQTLGDFEILEEIGRGGMGVVYRARQKSLDRIVALKMLLAAYFKKPHRLERFRAEARAAARLAHPNIVSIYQVGECAAGHFYTMELVEGRSLETVIAERGLVPVSWAVSLMIPVTQAVHYAHSHGIVHRDLKPSNIMLDRLRRPVVLDFGLAKFVSEEAIPTRKGVVMGTPAYMAPEQAGNDQSQVGPAADIYSLGAVLYHLLTGRPPFLENTVLKTVMRVLSSDPPEPIAEFRDDVPERVQHLCMKCLRKVPEDRYASAEVVLRRLRRIYAGLPKKAPPDLSRKRKLADAVLVAQETGDELRLKIPTTLIGRSSECDIVVKASDVSKRHCLVRVEEGRMTLEDLSSSNGTRLNGVVVERGTLEDADMIDIAGHSFQIRVSKLPPA